jgi:hypothetical protein
MQAFHWQVPTVCGFNLKSVARPRAGALALAQLDLNSESGSVAWV